MPKSARKIAYCALIAYVFISPVFSVSVPGPSVFQSWLMYVATRNLCTLRFSDPQGQDTHFHEDTQRLLNLGLFRGANAPLILPTEENAGQLINAYCRNPKTRGRPFRVQLQCFKENTWTPVENLGDTSCKD